MYIIILLLSIWQSILFWNKTPGISVILFIIPFLIFLIKYMEKENKIKNKKAKLIAIPIILLSATYFIFDNMFLNDVNRLAILTLIILMVIELMCDNFTLEKVVSNVFSFIFKPIGYIGNVSKNIIGKIKKDEGKKNKTPKNFKRIAKAILISIPLLLFVFILLITADSEFSKLFINTTEHIVLFIEKIQISNIASRIIGIIIVFFYISGFMENILLTNDIERNKKEINKKDNLSIKFIITVLNIMYLVFCIVQVKSLYKIYNMDPNFSNYTRNGIIGYAYYARQGFFQLIVVSAINLVVLLQSKKKCYNKEKYITLMDLSMIALTLFILISAFIRMCLYQQVYGLTLKRVLVIWAEITEGALLIPTAMYVLDKKLNLEKSYFTIIVTMYVILNFVNINRIIAKRNVDMYLQGKSISESGILYAAKANPDAVPEIIRIIDNVGEKEQFYKDVENEMQQKLDRQGNGTTLNDINFYQYKDENKEALKDILNLIKEDLDKQTSWQEFNISKYKASKILSER